MAGFAGIGEGEFGDAGEGAERVGAEGDAGEFGSELFEAAGGVELGADVGEIDGAIELCVGEAPRVCDVGDGAIGRDEVSGEEVGLGRAEPLGFEAEMADALRFGGGELVGAGIALVRRSIDGV